MRWEAIISSVKGWINQRESFLGQTRLAELRKASLLFPTIQLNFLLEACFYPLQHAGEEIAACFPSHPHPPPAEQLLLIFMPLSPASSPLSRSLSNSTEELLASLPRESTDDSHLSLGKSCSLSTLHLLLLPLGPSRATFPLGCHGGAGRAQAQLVWWGCKPSPPAALCPASSGEAEISLWASRPGLCSARGHASAGAYLSI